MYIVVLPSKIVVPLSRVRVCLHQMLQADWSMRGPIFHLET